MTHTELDSLLHRSEELHELLDSLVVFKDLALDQRSVIVLAQAGFSMQLARSQRILIGRELDASAMALVRVQFESTLRAIWLASSATSEQLQKYLEVGTDGDLKNANQGPTVDDMLASVARGPAPHMASTLKALKTATWRAMNHYNHGSLLAAAHSASDRQPQQLANALLNSNGMLVMAANASLVASAHRPTADLAEVIGQFADCLPPQEPLGNPRRV